MENLTHKEVNDKVTELLKQYDLARSQNDWQTVARVEPILEEYSTEQKLRHFAQMEWKPKGYTIKKWKKWKRLRGF